MKYLLGLIALMQICRGMKESNYEMGQGEIAIAVSKQGEIELMAKIIKPDVKVLLADDFPLLLRDVKLPSVFRIHDG